MLALRGFPALFTLALSAHTPHPLPKVTLSSWLTESKQQLGLPSSSRPFPSKCPYTTHPGPFASSASFLIAMHLSPIACISHAQLTPHPLQLTLQVVLEESAMGKDRHIEGASLPQDPFIWSCPPKRKWVDLHFPTEASSATAEECSHSQAPSSLLCPEAFSRARTALKTPVCCPFKYMLQTNLWGEFQRGKTNAFPPWHTLSFLGMLKAEINSL